MMRELLSVFALNHKTLNKLRNVIIHLREHGKTTDDFLEYAKEYNENHRKVMLEVEKVRASQVLCSECKRPMGLRPVNFDNATKTNDNSKSVWMCFNKDCMHTEYSEKTIEQWRNELTRRK